LEAITWLENAEKSGFMYLRTTVEKLTTTLENLGSEKSGNSQQVEGYGCWL
jgi:hypothetical protein